MISLKLKAGFVYGSLNLTKIKERFEKSQEL